MQLHSVHHSLQATDLPLDKLHGNATLSNDDKISELSRQFEAVLLRKILENAQKPVLDSKSGSPSVVSGIYQDMITSRIADQVSKSGDFGLARSLEHQLRRELNPEARSRPMDATPS